MGGGAGVSRLSESGKEALSNHEGPKQDKAAYTIKGGTSKKEVLENARKND